MNKELLTFLKKVNLHNDRDWFKEHKSEYDALLAQWKDLSNHVRIELDKTDFIESHTTYRIYRDIRFSKDKSPFKSYITTGFKRATNKLRGGYYMEIQPGNKSFAGGGFWSPNNNDIKRIRQEFSVDPLSITAIEKDRTFKKYFGTIKGESLKTAPRGFDLLSQRIDLIKKKQFLVMRTFSDEEVVSPNFGKEVVKTFIAMKPFLDYMSYILTTDSNGEFIV